MYRLKLLQGGEESPPSVAFGVAPDSLGILQNDEAIAHDIGQSYFVRPFEWEPHSYGFNGTGVLLPINRGEVDIAFSTETQPDANSKQRVREVVAGIHFVTETLNGEIIRRRQISEPIEEPQIKLYTRINPDEMKWAAHQFNVVMSEQVVTKIDGMSDAELRELEKTVRSGMIGIGNPYFPNKEFLEDRCIARIQAIGKMSFSCPGDHNALSNYGSSDARTLNTHNVDTALEQLMLIGGIAAMATHLSGFDKKLE